MSRKPRTDRKQSPRWITLGLKVIDGEADPFRDEVSNNDTLEKTYSYLKILLKGLPLSQKQSRVFIDNIKNRVPGQKDFEFDGIIRLTQKQITDAKVNPAYRRLIGFVRQMDILRSEAIKAAELKLRAIGDDEEGIVRFFDYISAYGTLPVQTEPEAPANDVEGASVKPILKHFQ